MALYLNDITSNNNDLTNNGATEVTSSMPFPESTSAALFASADSDNMSAVDAASLKPTGNFTIECWVKTAGSPTTGTIFSSYSANTNVAGIQMRIDGAGKLRGVSGRNTGTLDGTDFQDISSATSINNNAWHHCAFVYDGAKLYVYVDVGSGGTDDGNIVWTNAAGYAATNYFRIGCNNDSGSNNDYVNATIDEVRLWNVAKTGAQLYASKSMELTGNEANLQAYWPFESTLGPDSGKILFFI